MVGHAEPTESDALGKRTIETLLYVGGRNTMHFCGGFGIGQVAKIAHNYVTLCNDLAATGGMALGLKYSIDKKALWNVMTNGTASSWVMGLEQPVPGLVADAPSSNRCNRAFVASLSVKDLGIAINPAKKVGLQATAGETAIKALQIVDVDPCIKNLDHTSLWLHVNGLVEDFV